MVGNSCYQHKCKPQRKSKFYTVHSHSAFNGVNIRAGLFYFLALNFIVSCDSSYVNVNSVSAGSGV